MSAACNVFRNFGCETHAPWLHLSAEDEAKGRFAKSCPVQTLVNCIIVLGKGCIPFGNILQQPDIGSKTLLVSLRLSVYVDALRYGQQHG